MVLKRLVLIRPEASLTNKKLTAVIIFDKIIVQEYHQLMKQVIANLKIKQRNVRLLYFRASDYFS